MRIVRYGFQMHNILTLLMFVAVIGIIISNLFRSGKQWKKDESSPRLTVPATVVTKRDDYRRRRNGKHTTHRTYYYATFQFESGDRLELQLEGHEYGLIVEGDKGKLTFQGSRFLGFERT